MLICTDMHMMRIITGVIIVLLIVSIGCQLPTGGETGDGPDDGGVDGTDGGSVDDGAVDDGVADGSDGEDVGDFPDIAGDGSTLYTQGFDEGVFPGSTWGQIAGQGFYLESLEDGTIMPEVVSERSWDGEYSLRLNDLVLHEGQSAGVETGIEVEGSASLSFYFSMELGSGTDTFLRVYVNDLQRGEWSSEGAAWQQVTIPLPEGSPAVRWMVEKEDGYYFPTLENAVWIDGISVATDEAAAVVMEPDAPQRVVAGGDSLQFSASAARSDGSLLSGIDISYTVVPITGDGVIRSGGEFQGTSPGTCRIAAAVQPGGIPLSYSMEIEVLSPDYLSDSFSYGDEEYAGAAEGGSGEPAGTVEYTGLSVTEPSVAVFEADAFFRLTGTNELTDAERYTLVEVVKSEDDPDSETGTDVSAYTGTGESPDRYYLDGDFDLRIWLRYGAGEYTVKVTPMTVLSGNDIDETFDGAVGAYTYGYPAAYTFTVTNTRDESGVFLYPSPFVQSDDLDIYNIAMTETHGIENDTELIRSLHDWVVAYLSYDYDSLEVGRRKRQDAVSVLGSVTAVCDGYAGLFAALLRAAGYRTKSVAGIGYTDPETGIAHAWTEVQVGEVWYFTDVTWDDPGPYDDDPDGGNVRYDYFLLTDPSGIDGDHTLTDERPERTHRPGYDINLGYSQM